MFESFHRFTHLFQENCQLMNQRIIMNRSYRINRYFIGKEKRSSLSLNAVYSHCLQEYQPLLKIYWILDDVLGPVAMWIDKANDNDTHFRVYLSVLSTFLLDIRRHRIFHGGPHSSQRSIRTSFVPQHKTFTKCYVASSIARVSNAFIYYEKLVISARKNCLLSTER